MSPQRSNRQQLLEGTLSCLERLPPERVTARAIAEESQANLASIAYHFGSKDNLVTEAVILGLDRWLQEIEAGMGDLSTASPAARYRSASQAMERTKQRHTALARNFISALARAQHDERLRELLAEGFEHTRPELAKLLGLGTDQAGEDSAGLVLGLFYGVLIQELLDPRLGIESDRMHAAQARLRTLLPDSDEPP